MKNLEERKLSFIGGGKITEVFISRYSNIKIVKDGYSNLTDELKHGKVYKKLINIVKK